MRNVLRFRKSLVAFIVSFALANSARLWPLSAKAQTRSGRLKERLMLGMVMPSNFKYTVEFSASFPFVQLRRSLLESVRVLVLPSNFAEMSGAVDSSIVRPSAFALSYMVQGCPGGGGPIFIPSPGGGTFCPSFGSPLGFGSGGTDSRCFG
jgi:hypothetical protein